MVSSINLYDLSFLIGVTRKKVCNLLKLCYYGHSTDKRATKVNYHVADTENFWELIGLITKDFHRNALTASVILICVIGKKWELSQIKKISRLGSDRVGQRNND